MKHRFTFAAYTIVLAALLLLGISIGPEAFEPTHVMNAIINYSTTQTPTALQVAIFDLRLPRIILALILGAAMGVAGAVTQGVFRNALAEPGILGISMGAACAVVTGMVLGLDDALWVTPILAGLGACTIMLILHRLAGRSDTSLLLTGLALGTFCAACVTMLLAIHVERWELGIKVVMWLMGTFEARSWSHVVWAIPPTTVGIGLAYYLRRDLDLLHLGVDTASSLGVNLNHTRAMALLCIAILVGATTALVGVIGFIGLMIPHVARTLFGPKHSTVLGFSALFGALMLLLVDMMTRSMTSIMLPPGVLTSFIGAPFFIWLLTKKTRISQ